MTSSLNYLVCAVVLAGCRSDPPAAPAPDASGSAFTEAMRTDIAAYATAAVARYQVPGAAVAVVVGGETVYQQGFGVRGLDDTRPVTPDTLFLIGSLTKSMTGLVAATLVDDGLARWDQPVVELLPGFALSDPAVTPQIRLQDLLGHTAGVAGHDPALLVERFSPLELMRSLAGIPLRSAPGAEFHYSNQAFTVGGYAAAIAAGATPDDDLAARYAALMQARVFDPIGMRSTTLDFDAASASANHALPHAFDPATGGMARLPLDLERFVQSVAPAGAAWSNVGDLARYAIAQFDGVSPDGTRVVSQDNLRQTQTAHVAIGNGFGYGFGWIAAEPAAFHGRRAVLHTGGTNGFITHIAVLPDDHIGVVVFSNDQLGDGFCTAVREYIVETVLGLAHAGDDAQVVSLRDTEAALVELAHAVTPPTAEQVAGVVGGYGDRLSVAFSAARGLTLETDFGPRPLAAMGPDAFASTGVTAGLAATSSAAGDRLTIGTISPEPGEFALTLARRADPAR